VYGEKGLSKRTSREPSPSEVVELPDELLGLLRRVAGESLPELSERVQKGASGGGSE
jgi:hypothetical protein